MEATEILKKKAIKVTSQRVKILDYLLEFKVHPTAEQIYGELSNSKEVLSLATVYNALTLFVELGIVKKISGPNETAVFDIVTEDHYHFFCSECDKIFDIPSEMKELSSLDLKGHKAVSFQGWFKGICNNCNKGVKKKNLLNLLKQKVRIFTRR